MSISVMYVGNVMCTSRALDGSGDACASRNEERALTKLLDIRENSALITQILVIRRSTKK